MSGDWTETLPDPTLCIQYPWDERPVGWCLNCGERVSTSAKAHAMIADHPLKSDGCGIQFRYVTTEAVDEPWINRVREMRTDLAWRSFNVKHPMTDEARRLTKFEQGGSKRLIPMFAWDKAAPAGEGRAGNYLAHLRENPPTVKANNFLVQAAAAAGMEVEDFMKMPKDFRFPFIYGSGRYEHVKDKETPMPSYTLTVEVTDLLALAKVVEAIDRTVTGARVECIGQPLTFEPIELSITNNFASSAYGAVAQKRVHVEEKAAIREYLTKVVSANAESTGAAMGVSICYEAEGTGERTTRECVPYRIEQRAQTTWPYGQRDYLVLRDVDKDAMRTFLVENIISIDGPTP